MRLEFFRWVEVYLAGVTMMWVFIGALGCAQQEYYKPRGWSWKVQPGEVAAWKHGIEPDGTMGSHFEVFARGVERRPVGARKIRTFRVGMEVANNTGKPMTLDSQEAYLVDRTGEVLRCSSMRVSGALKPFAHLRPNAHAQLDMYFDLGTQTRDMNQFTVHWRYTVDDQPYSQESTFVRGFHGWAD